MSVVGLGALLFGVIEGPGRGWTSPFVIGAIVVGAVALVAFVRREPRVSSPLFDVRILRRPAVATGSLTLLLAYVVFNSFLFLNPQYLHDVQGESIVLVGLLFAPFALVFGACSLQAQRVVGRLGARSTITLGLVVSATAAAGFAVAVNGPLWETVAATVILGVGLSALIAPPSTVVMNALPASKAGDGSSLNFVSRFAGASVGVAIVGSIAASIFARDLDPAPHVLTSGQLDRAEGSLQGALTVADTLAPSAQRSLRLAAQDAFDRGATVAYAAVAVLALVAAAVAWVTLGRTKGDKEARGAVRADRGR
jgi:MFS family permease